MPERYVVRASTTVAGVWGVWDTERRQWSLYVTEDEEDAERLCVLWNALDGLRRKKGQRTGGEAWATSRRRSMGNIDARELRAVLLAHAEEIAGAANAAPEDTVVLAIVGDDGTWRGVRIVSPNVMRPESERTTTEGFFVPTTCYTVEAVKRFIDEALGDVEE